MMFPTYFFFLIPQVYGRDCPKRRLLPGDTTSEYTAQMTLRSSWKQPPVKEHTNILY